MTFSLIGVDTQTGKRIQLSQSARRQGLYLIGSSGTGKSGLIESLVLEDIKQGLGVCVLDPHGDLVDAILKRLPGRERDVILLDIGDENYPFGLNLLECQPSMNRKAVQLVLEQTMHLFELFFDLSVAPASLPYILRNGIQTLLANPGYTLADFPLLFTNKQVRDQLLENISDPSIRLFWNTFEAMKLAEQFEYAGVLLQKVSVFLDPLLRNIIGQSKSTLDFRSIIDQRKILLVKLDARLPQLTSLLGTTIIAQLLTAALSRSDLELTKRKQFNLYADEFQLFATDDIARLIAEARKFGIATTIAHQRRSQLKHDAKAAVLAMANLVAFRVSGEDAQELKEHFPVPSLPAELRREEKLVPIQTPATWMVQGHPHSNPAVRAFLSRFPAPREEEQYNLFRTYEHALNQLLYQVMLSQNPTSLLGQVKTIQLFLSIMQYHDTYLSSFYPLSAAAPRHQIDFIEDRDKRPTPDFGAHYVLSFWKWPPEYAYDASQVEDLLAPVFGAPDDGHFEQAAAEYTKRIEWLLTEDVKAHLAQYVTAHTEEQKATLQAAFDDQLIPTKWNQNREERRSRHLYAREIGTVADEVERCEEIVAYWMTTERAHFEAFVKEVRTCVVALNQEPVLTRSGVFETVPVGNMPSANVADLIASELTTLSDHMAKVRMKEGAGKQIVGYTIHTVEPGQQTQLWGSALQERIAAIQQQNRLEGFVRARKEVEEEMKQRQTQSGREAQQTHPLLLASRESRCHACGADNSQEAKFCNQCGGQL